MKDNFRPVFFVGMFLDVLEHFDKDYDRTLEWFRTQNPGLGNVRPSEMLTDDRWRKLDKFIRNSLEENKR